MFWCFKNLTIDSFNIGFLIHDFSSRVAKSRLKKLAHSNLLNRLFGLRGLSIWHLIHAFYSENSLETICNIVLLIHWSAFVINRSCIIKDNIQLFSFTIPINGISDIFRWKINRRGVIGAGTAPNGISDILRWKINRRGVVDFVDAQRQSLCRGQEHASRALEDSLCESLALPLIPSIGPI